MVQETNHTQPSQYYEASHPATLSDFLRHNTGIIKLSYHDQLVKTSNSYILGILFRLYDWSDEFNPI